MMKDGFFSAVAVIAVVVLSPPSWGRSGPTGPADPSDAGANPRPEWPFLWLFGLLSLSPPAAETFIMLVFPVILIVVLLPCPSCPTAANGRRAAGRWPCCPSS